MTEKERLIEILLDGVTFTDQYGQHARVQAEYMADKLLDNGVIVPPCKVGQTMYEVSRYYNGTWEIYECKVDEITMYEKHTFIRMKSWENLVFAENTSEIGKCVFYTREEAEKALAERNNK